MSDFATELAAALNPDSTLDRKRFPCETRTAASFPHRKIVAVHGVERERAQKAKLERELRTLNGRSEQ